jgi:hypothetical protein
MGGRMWDSAEAAKRQKVFDEQNAIRFAREGEAYDHAKHQRETEEAAFRSYGDIESTGQTVGLNTSGFSDGSARMLASQGGQGAVDSAASYANVENARVGLAPSYQTSGESAPTVQMRDATDRDRLNGRRRIAIARRDVAALGAIEAEDKNLAWDEGFSRHYREYKGTEDQIGATAAHINNNSSRITMQSSPDAKGVVRASVVKADGQAEFLKLSRQDQAKLYAAGKLMELNPTRALTMMAEVNKELAAAVAADSGIQFKAAEHNERGRHNQAVEKAAQTTANASASYYGARSADIANDRKDTLEARKLVDAYDLLTPEEQGGAKGQGLIRKYNMLTPGKQVSLAGTGGAKAGAKYEADNVWQDAEKTLIGNGTDPAAIEMQRNAFYARRGFAPKAAVAALLSGRDPASGTKLTEQDVDQFNATFPHTPVDKSKLPWLQPKPSAAPAPQRGGSPFQDSVGAWRRRQGQEEERTRRLQSEFSH